MAVVMVAVGLDEVEVAVVLDEDGVSTLLDGENAGVFAQGATLPAPGCSGSAPGPVTMSIVVCDRAVEAMG